MPFKIYSPYLLWMFPVVYFVFLGFKILPTQLDDAYIAYHYAENFIKAQELTFNPGGGRVEGFSSPLWLLLCVLVGVIFGLESLQFAGPILGCTAVIASLITATTLRDKRLFFFLILLISSPSFIFYNYTGLESATFAMAMGIFVYGLIYRKTLLACGALAAALLLRPEGMWAIVILAIYFAFNPKEVKSNYVLVGLYFLMVMLIFAVRGFYFEALFPNTYHAKPANYLNAFRYLLDAFTSVYFLAYFLPALVVAVLGKNETRVMFIMGLSWCVAAFLEGGDWMELGRFLLPAIALFCLALASYMVDKKPHYGVLLMLILCLGGYVVLSRALTPLKVSENFINLHYRELKHLLMKQAVRSVGMVDIGEFAYGSDIKILDLAGLTDKYIATLPGEHLRKAISRDYLIQQAVDVYILRMLQNPLANTNSNTIHFSSPTEAMVFKEAFLGLGYKMDFYVVPSIHTEGYGGLLVLSHPGKFPRPLSANIPQISTRYALPALIIQSP